MVCSVPQSWNPLVSFPTSLQRVKRYWWTTLLIWLCWVAPAQAQLLLRVAIEDGANQVKVGSTTKAIVRDGNGQALGELVAMGGGVAQTKSGKVALGNWQGSQLWIDPSNNGNVWIGNGWYRGRVLLVPRNGKLTAINYVDLEEYLYSVLGAEMDGGWPQEALKAQAVAARTYALYKRQRSNGIFDVGDDQGWQVYKGLVTESTGTVAAVNATRGQVLTYNGQAILAAFHSASGGHTENVEDVWNEPLPYLRGVPDFDQGTPVFEWTKTFSQADLSKRISGVGSITTMTPQRTSAFGSILAMKVVGDKGTRVMSGEDIASALGLRSTRFQISRKSGTTSFQVTGRGFGHAVGLSQWGAYNLARGGYNYQQILAHYYRNTNLAKIEVR
ncbi:SpoIID/LytB domain-containing protein [Planktothrix mougeotii]|uniref:SpoIID/LytB domain-containing protein n=1 Tax=Planktothrix mougeotii LEGE 06226 TaxID=1828728 RepID=A0ABR9UB34_9CYAN|nr:SpoIID/LytB domain-containing protein [Planktothrix mougeotii]MBE9143396.1 SpoIID/LytB domain-containing protein [Planktothrix mougeotii LEGE 06226]